MRLRASRSCAERSSVATASGGRGPGPERAYAALLPEVGAVVLDAEESAHLVRVRRVAAGQAVVLFNGLGATVIGTLTKADPRAAAIQVTGAHPARIPARVVRLAVSLPEPARADRMVAMLAELGVAELTPIMCARTDPGRRTLAQRRAQRWQRAAREALKVNGAAHALRIHPTRPYADVLGPEAVLLDPDPAAPDFAACLGGSEVTPWILIGPEGGFTEPELALATAADTPTARLGALALRTGTAAVTAAAVALATA